MKGNYCNPMFDVHYWLWTGFPLSLLHAIKSMDSGQDKIMINSFNIFSVWKKKNFRWLLLSAYLGSLLPWQIGLDFRKTSTPFSNSRATRQVMISNLCTNMRCSTCRYLTHAHVQNRWQQTGSSTMQKQNNPEQSLIESGSFMGFT